MTPPAARSNAGAGPPRRRCTKRIALATVFTARMRAGALLVSTIVASCVAPRIEPESAIVEIAAARSMMRDYADETITLDPRLARGQTAPGIPNAGRRDSARTAALAQELGVRVSTEFARPGAHLVLSEPVVRGDSATVSITVAWVRDERDGGAGYETRGLLLARERGLWRVVVHRGLGIT